ncbi:phosphonoacetaldehyde hydrolase [Bacillus sp. FSL K6-3431]|uniref:phosphonoacetaldehyde hydrolase n=1 Tax=Bacillus sp. FSL K6-3431 TaxID=2921500 RepID=UPI0030FBA769
MNKIEGVMLDWAGTTIDYGCFAPLKVFIEIFEQRGVTITSEEARIPMGLPKMDHVRAILEMSRVRDEWQIIHESLPTEKDIVEMYQNFERILFDVLPQYTTPIPHVIETIATLRGRGLKIGSTTGYTKEMMKVVAPLAKEKGYYPDTLFTPDDVKAGRPYPWMSYLNAMELGIYPMNKFIKVGDTISDIHEGLNAGMWTVGVILGSNELGLTEEEVMLLDKLELNNRMETVRQRMKEAGAHFVIDQFNELVSVIDRIEKDVNTPPMKCEVNK